MMIIILKITGKVQGVFFRDSAQKQADALNINGYAKNMPDGSVFIEAEGEEEALKQFIKWCEKGPELAEVDNVEIQWAEATGKYEEFKVE